MQGRYLRTPMRGLRSLILICSFSWLMPLFSQPIRDTTLALVSVQANYAQQFPGGDLADRFGTNSNAGLARSGNSGTTLRWVLKAASCSATR